MPSTEIEVLKFIWENKGKASWFRIVKELRFFNPDYCRLICQSLIKKKFVEFSDYNPPATSSHLPKGKWAPGQYKITGLGRKELEKLGIIEKAEKVAKPKKKVIVKKVIKEKVIKKEVKGTPIAGLAGLTSKIKEELQRKGFRTLEDIATTSVSRLTETIKDLGLKKAADVINKARDKLRKTGKEYLWEE